MPAPWVNGVRTITDYSGVAVIPLRAGGICPGGSVTVYVDGASMRTITRIASPDQDGDGTVSDGDLATVSAKLGTTDATADFDGDGLVTAADVDLARHHLGHSCEAATPAHRSSWGRLKRRYR